jgi:hypothetical protein
MQENTLRYNGYPYKKETEAIKICTLIKMSQRQSVHSVVIDAKNYNQIATILRVIERRGTMGGLSVSHHAASKLHVHGR